jgi:hypothetical protein
MASVPNHLAAIKAEGEHAVSAKVILEVLSGPIRGEIFEFDVHDTFLFGRRKDCHARISKDGYVSRHHFILETNPPDARIRDLGSRNGTFVNGVKHGGRAAAETPEQAAGRQYPEVDLKHGDQITVGQTTIRVNIELPLSCCQCHAEVPEADRQHAEWMTGSFLCADCRAKLVARRRPVTVVEMPQCQRCGKDVAAEVGNRHGQYVCQDCQSGLLAEDGGLRRLMQEAARGMSEAGAPGISNYEMGDDLGKGGMGAVYRAVRKADGRPVAVKVMLAKVAVDPKARDMFFREIEVTRQLDHPHIVKLFEHGVVGSAFFFVMELCNDGSLDRLIRRQGGKISLGMAAPIMLQCLDGLRCAHEKRFIHRDLKPQNILLDHRDGRWLAKISDFGLAKNFEMAGLSGMTATGSFGGTYLFMPREQLTQYKYFLPVSDLWSMAATFYNALSGQYPLDFPDNRDPMEVILHDDPVPLCRRDPSIPRPVAEVIDRALLSDPSRRYQDAAEMRAAVQRALERSCA